MERSSLALLDAKPSPAQLARTHIGDAGAFIIAADAAKTSEAHAAPRIVTWNLRENSMRSTAELCRAFEEVQSAATTRDHPGAERVLVELDISGNRIRGLESERLAQTIEVFAGRSEVGALRHLNVTNTGALQAAEASWAAAFDAVSAASSASGDSFTLCSSHEVLGGGTTKLRGVLAAIGALVGLRSLTLSHCLLDDAAVQGLVGRVKLAPAVTGGGEGGPRSRGGALDPVAAYCLAPTAFVAGRRPLQHLDLSHNSLGSEGLALLARAFIGVGTESVCLAANRVGAPSNAEPKRCEQMPWSPAAAERHFHAVAHDPRGLEELAVAVRRAASTLRLLDLRGNMLGGVKGVDRGGVSELCEAFRLVCAPAAAAKAAPTQTAGSLCREANQQGLLLQLNDFSPHAVTSLLRLSGFRASLQPQSASQSTR